MKNKIKVLKISKLKSGNKKYSAEFQIIDKNGKIKTKTTKFGAQGMSDFTIHKDTNRRERYISRHKKDLKTGDPTRAGYLSMYILWNKPSFSASLTDYKRRLNSYNRTGKFPNKITGSKLLKFGAPIYIPFEETTLRKLPTNVQRKIEKDVIKYNLNKKLSKMMLKNFLIKIRDENVNQKNLPLYNILDIADIKTIIFLKLARKLLKRSDFTPNSLWTNVVSDLLEELNDVRPLDNPNLNQEELQNIEETINQLEQLLMYLFNIYFDFDDERGEWAIKAYIELQEKIDEDNYEQNYFGTSAIIPVKGTQFEKLPDDLFWDKFQQPRINKMIESNYEQSRLKKLGKLIQELRKRAEYSAQTTRDQFNKNLYKTSLHFNLDPTNKWTAEWLEKVANLVQKRDFGKSEKGDRRNEEQNLWWNVVNFLLREMNNLEGDDDPSEILPKDEYENYDSSQTSVMKILNKCGYKLTIDDIDVGWAYDARIWWQERFTNSFGNLKNSELAKIPNNVKNKQLYLKIKNKIKKEIGNKRRWGAYDSGRLVREYKKEGGKYSEATKNKLSRWYREKWIDACAWPKRKSCGRDKATIKSKVTYCRPSIRVNKNTPKTIQELSKKQIEDKCKRKSKNPKKIIKN